jgi:hypothetical protein
MTNLCAELHSLVEEIGILQGPGKALSKADEGIFGACLNTDPEPIGNTEI